MTLLTLLCGFCAAYVGLFILFLLVLPFMV